MDNITITITNNKGENKDFIINKDIELLFTEPTINFDGTFNFPFKAISEKAIKFMKQQPTIE